MNPDEELFDYLGVDPKVFQHMKKDIRNKKKEETKAMMVSGEKEPKDLNFSELRTDDEVFVNLGINTPIIKGRIRMAYANDSYVIEHKENGILTWEMMAPGRKITSHKPYIFEINMPNHQKVFRNMKDLEMSHINFLTEHSKRSQIPIATLIGKIKEMIEEYPEEFI